MVDVPLSVLEVAVREEGRTAGEALAATTAVARGADELGYRRVWVAEHHGAGGFASVSPPVLLGHLADATARIRVGSGGTLVPNHAPYALAEQFMTLAALHPERIDMGIGRGPGTRDNGIATALRRGSPPTTDEEYRRDIDELLSYLSGESGFQILPGESPLPQPWVLSSSTGGAEIAASRGLPLAFAHHIRPENTVEAVDRYRTRFTPSRWGEQPHVLVSVQALTAETDEEAARLVRPNEILMAQILAGAGEQALLSPEAALDYELPPDVVDRIAARQATHAQGAPETVRARLKELADQTGADELMLTNLVYDPATRVRSLALIADPAGVRS